MTLPLSGANPGEVAMLTLPPMPARPSGAGPAPLTQREKAAIVVRFLLSEGAPLSLSDLPEDLQTILARQFAQMRHVDRATLAAVVAEFAEELEQIALLFPHGVAGALSALDGKISLQTATRLRREAGVRQNGDPWVRLRTVNVEQLLPFMTSEATEVAAVVLSKLDVARAADLLGRLPGPVARRIAFAMSQTAAVTPEAVYRIGMSLAMQLDAVPDRAFADGPEERIGAILNLSTTETRNDVLSGLEEVDAHFAEGVRRALFTYPDIADRLSAQDIPRLTRAVDQQVLMTAMIHAATLGEKAVRATDFILASMSSRMADALREGMAQSGPVKAKAGEEAITTVITAIRSLESAGEITLIVPGAEDD
jgi:flagellar motor switch protein FliG